LVWLTYLVETRESEEYDESLQISVALAVIAGS